MPRKGIDKSMNYISGLKTLPSKFSPSIAEGSRVAPSKSKDHQCDLRIDAGKYDPSTKKLNVVLQVNSQTTSPSLKNWIQRNSTHAKLATAEYDTAAPNQYEETKRVLTELSEKAKKKL